MTTKSNGRIKLKRTKRACSARGKALKRTGSTVAASRLAKLCPPPGRRRKPNASRTAPLDVVAARAGLEYRTHSPGDGQTRYKFFEAGTAPGDYFAGNGVHTALGRAKAIAYAEEYEAAAAHTRTPRDAPVYLPTGRLTMADVKRASRERSKRVGHTSGADFFSRGNTRFFGPERFHGPYRGPGGIFFVTSNKTGNLVRQLLPNGDIETMGTSRGRLFDTAEDAKDHAKHLAKFGTGARTR